MKIDEKDQWFKRNAERGRDEEELLHSVISL